MTVNARGINGEAMSTDDILDLLLQRNPTPTMKQPTPVTKKRKKLFTVLSAAE